MSNKNPGFLQQLKKGFYALPCFCCILYNLSCQIVACLAHSIIFTYRRVCIILIIGRPGNTPFRYKRLASPWNDNGEFCIDCNSEFRRNICFVIIIAVVANAGIIGGNNSTVQNAVSFILLFQFQGIIRLKLSRDFHSCRIGQLRLHGIILYFRNCNGLDLRVHHRSHLITTGGNAQQQSRTNLCKNEHSRY